jgi:hypothetical protein
MKAESDCIIHGVRNLSHAVLTLAICFVLPTISRGQDLNLSELSRDFNPHSKQQLQTADTARLEAPYLLAPHNSIREVIPKKYQQRYQRWKNEFLATAMGRRQWQMFQRNPDFTLTVTVSPDSPHGAKTGKFKWNDSGELVAATIALGAKIDEGYPSRAPYPVTESLAIELPYSTRGELLAATKIAHEFGHLNQVVSDGARFQLQNQLIHDYQKILLTNGHNVLDPMLSEWAERMGGTAAQISEDREYWSEVNALLYLLERRSKKSLQCALIKRIRDSIELYGKRYEKRFAQISESKASISGCRWAR